MNISFNNSIFTIDVPELDMDQSECENCDFNCWEAGFCVKEKIFES